MAIRNVGSPIHCYLVLASDAKPDPNDEPEGSTLHIVDTGEQYIVYDGAWEPDKRLTYALKQAGI